jgi:phage repressor protein C with HTH and peptisase S24 domain
MAQEKDSPKASTHDQERGKRIKKLMREKGIKRDDLAKKIGKAGSSVSFYTSGGLFPPEVGEILAKELDTSVEHLLYGRKESQQEYVNANVNNTVELGAIKKKGIPYYDIQASGGPVEMFMDLPEEVSDYYYLPDYEDCDLCLNIWGDSMYPHYVSGDVIICKRIFNQDIISYGDTYLIITREYRFVKYIYPDDEDKGKIILRSENKKYPDIPIPRKEILRMFLVKGKVQRKII